MGALRLTTRRRNTLRRWITGLLDGSFTLADLELLVNMANQIVEGDRPTWSSEQQLERKRELAQARRDGVALGRKEAYAKGVETLLTKALQVQALGLDKALNEARIGEDPDTGLEIYDPKAVDHKTLQIALNVAKTLADKADPPKQKVDVQHSFLMQLAKDGDLD